MGVNNYIKYVDLAGKSVFITGGATGIGAELVSAFCHQGANVTFVDINDGAGIALQHAIGKEGTGKATYISVDVADVKALVKSISETIENQGRLDILVNNVANDDRHQASTVSETYWRRCMAVNLDSAFFAAQAAQQSMKNNGGSIITVGSINSILCPENMTGYVAAKSALIGMTKSLAREWGKEGIRVNAVLPGWVITERQVDLWLTPEVEEHWMKQVSLKERIYPDEIARLCLFLASRESRMITGQSIVIDGGRT